MRTEATDRIKLVFTLFDANGNGVLEADDFALMGSRVVQAARESDSAAKTGMIAAFTRFWATLEAELDSNRDGVITYDAFSACVLSPEKFDTTIGEFADALAALGDPDGDGLIGRPLFIDLMTAIGFERANVDALFDAFDPSSADEIKVSTWVLGIKEYYNPNKAGIPGDRLVPDLVV